MSNLNAAKKLDPEAGGGLAGAPSFSRSLRKGWETTNPHGPSVSNLAVLGADTTVALDDHILGKPESPADAARMLRLLSGRTHRVLTGVALVTATSTQVAAESTAVQFLTLSDEEIAAYISTGEPMDKAGAYAIQGRAVRARTVRARTIRKIELARVRGVPHLRRLEHELREFGRLADRRFDVAIYAVHVPEDAGHGRIV